jgi:hypothetical protein
MMRVSAQPCVRDQKSRIVTKFVIVLLDFQPSELQTRIA